jgi:quinol monooxygenase YgiN
MSVVVRLFDTAVDPSDVQDATKLFRDQVRPVFESFEGCHGIEMVVGLEERSGDLIDVLAISRWDSVEAIGRAVGTSEYDSAMQGLRELFKRTPIVRHFEGE